MASLTIENADQILARAIEQLKSNTQITRFTPGSKARTLLGILASEAEKLEQSITSSLILGLINGANGIYLDFIGELVGVQRGRRSQAEVYAEDQIISIYVESPLTFGDLNAGRPISIPSGTIISSADGSIRYSTTRRLTLMPDDSNEPVPARSLRYGAGGNIGRGALSVIEFTGYSAHPNLKLKVTNVSSIEGGTESDSDAFYRYKIMNSALSSETGNATAVRLAALSAQSVADALILPLSRGVGTADIILDTQDGIVSSQTLESVTRAVRAVESLGADILVRAPRLVGLEVAVDVKYVRGVSQAEKTQVNRNIGQAISDLVAQVGLGQTLTLNSIGAAIMEADSRIADIGTPGTPLSEVILWRGSQITGGRRPAILRGADLPLLIDERLTLEGSLSESVRITEK
jgi:uncharacterized phage protein gp47/JayE